MAEKKVHGLRENLGDFSDFVTVARVGGCTRVASYTGRVISGKYYVYRITRPERATLGLRHDRQGRWHLDQLAGPPNRNVSIELRTHVLKWFHASIRQRLAAAGAGPPPRRRRRGPGPDDPANPMLPGM